MNDQNEFARRHFLQTTGLFAAGAGPWFEELFQRMANADEGNSPFTGGHNAAAGFTLGLGLELILACCIYHLDGTDPTERVEFDSQHRNLIVSFLLIPIAPGSLSMNCRIRLTVASIFAALCSSVASGDENYWLAVGHGGQRTLSSDGQAWTQVGSWSKPGHNQDDLNVAANFKGAFYAGGGYFSGRLTATRDGKTWNDGVIPGSSPIFGLEVMDDALFAMDLRGKVFKTLDGEKWQLAATPEMPPPTETMRTLAQERSKDGKPVSDAQAQGHWVRGTARSSPRWPARTRRIPARSGLRSATACSWSWAKRV
jgi:hypothetical protein